MDIVHPDIDAYLHALTPPRDNLLTEMERLASETNFPIVGPLVGRLLYQLAAISGARRILELGSGFGYSAYWFALALPEDGRIICTEGSRERSAQIRDYFERAGRGSMVEVKTGNALHILRTLEGPFDIVFNDIDKEGYPEALQSALPLLRPGGLFVSDNVLWSGSVVERSDRPDVVAIQKFNEMLYSANGLTTTIIPLRDGVSVSVKDRRESER